MEDYTLHEQLKKFNSIFKGMDETYHSLARHYGLSDCAMWILYVLRESDTINTQAKMCAQLSLSKQTVNSALKSLEKSGYIELKSIFGNQKNKRVLLTGDGIKLAEQTVENILLMERNALKSFSPEQRIAFLKLNEKYARQLQNEANKILCSDN